MRGVVSLKGALAMPTGDGRVVQGTMARSNRGCLGKRAKLSSTIGRVVRRMGLCLSRWTTIYYLPGATEWKDLER